MVFRYLTLVLILLLLSQGDARNTLKLPIKKHQHELEIEPISSEQSIEGLLKVKPTRIPSERKRVGELMF